MSPTDPLTRANARYRKSLEAADEARENLHQAIRAAVKAGMTQSEVAERIEWDRQRVWAVMSSKRKKVMRHA